MTNKEGDVVLSGDNILQFTDIVKGTGQPRLTTLAIMFSMTEFGMKQMRPMDQPKMTFPTIPIPQMPSVQALHM